MLEMQGLDYAYPGGVAALADVSLTIQPGEKLAILGANGAGKSTLLNMLCGALRPERGKVCLDGRELRYDKSGLRDLRSQVGLVLQDPDDQLFAASVFEDVSFGPANLDLSAEEIRARVDAALESLDIADLRERPTHMLSFGQRKRVAIAGIVAMQPRYLLLDEPSAGLDPLGVEHLMVALGRISAQGTAIALATHDVDMAYAWADRLVVFYSGKIACSGGPDEVFVDKELLKVLRMRAPIVWDIACALRKSGAIDSSLPMPRNREAVLAQLKSRI
jgi:cobalt/nickel transport system ATP-binding protein